GLGILRRKAADEAVHGLAPRPEGILPAFRIARRWWRAALAQAGHGALEGMGMQVGHAGDDGAWQAHRLPRWSIRGGGEDGAALIGLDQHIPCPALGQQCGGSMKSRHGRASRLLATSIISMLTRVVNTTMLNPYDAAG